MKFSPKNSEIKPYGIIFKIYYKKIVRHLIKSIQMESNQAQQKITMGKRMLKTFFLSTLQLNIALNTKSLQIYL